MCPLSYFTVTVALCVAPFVFNPHQFSMGDFLVDYREYLRWLSRGNTKSHANSWIGYCRLSRTRITGFKKKKLGVPSEKLSVEVPRAGWKTIFISELSGPLVQAVVLLLAYTFTKSLSERPVNSLLRLAIVSLGPIVWNAIVLIVVFFTALFAGPLLNSCCNKVSIQDIELYMQVTNCRSINPSSELSRLQSLMPSASWATLSASSSSGS